MLEIRDIYKTFNAGTINEKKALQGVIIIIAVALTLTRDRKTIAK